MMRDRDKGDRPTPERLKMLDSYGKLGPSRTRLETGVDTPAAPVDVPESEQPMVESAPIAPTIPPEPQPVVVSVEGPVSVVPPIETPATSPAAPEMQNAESHSIRSRIENALKDFSREENRTIFLKALTDAFNDVKKGLTAETGTKITEVFLKDLEPYHEAQKLRRQVRDLYTKATVAYQSGNTIDDAERQAIMGKVDVLLADLEQTKTALAEPSTLDASTKATIQAGLEVELLGTEPAPAPSVIPEPIPTLDTSVPLEAKDLSEEDWKRSIFNELVTLRQQVNEKPNPAAYVSVLGDIRLLGAEIDAATNLPKEERVSFESSLESIRSVIEGGGVRMPDTPGLDKFMRKDAEVTPSPEPAAPVSATDIASDLEQDIAAELAGLERASAAAVEPELDPDAKASVMSGTEAALMGPDTPAVPGPTEAASGAEPMEKRWTMSEGQRAVRDAQRAFRAAEAEFQKEFQNQSNKAGARVRRMFGIRPKELPTKVQDLKNAADNARAALRATAGKLKRVRDEDPAIMNRTQGLDGATPEELAAYRESRHNKFWAERTVDRVIRERQKIQEGFLTPEGRLAKSAFFKWYRKQPQAVKIGLRVGTVGLLAGTAVGLPAAALVVGSRIGSSIAGVAGAAYGDRKGAKKEAEKAAVLQRVEETGKGGFLDNPELYTQTYEQAAEERAKATRERRAGTIRSAALAGGAVGLATGSLGIRGAIENGLDLNRPSMPESTTPSAPPVVRGEAPVESALTPAPATLPALDIPPVPAPPVESPLTPAPEPTPAPIQEPAPVPAPEPTPALEPVPLSPEPIVPAPELVAPPVTEPTLPVEPPTPDVAVESVTSGFQPFSYEITRNEGSNSIWAAAREYLANRYPGLDARTAEERILYFDKYLQAHPDLQAEMGARGPDHVVDPGTLVWPQGAHEFFREAELRGVVAGNGTTEFQNGEWVVPREADVPVPIPRPDSIPVADMETTVPASVGAESAEAVAPPPMEEATEPSVEPEPNNILFAANENAPANTDAAALAAEVQARTAVFGEGPESRGFIGRMMSGGENPQQAFAGRTLADIQSLSNDEVSRPAQLRAINVSEDDFVRFAEGLTRIAEVNPGLAANDNMTVDQFIREGVPNLSRAA